ncbi:MAG: ABC transporter permease subunit [Gemmatimonadota bacterium]
MTVAALVRNERIKTLRRPAFRVAVIAFTALIGLNFIGDFIFRIRQDEPLRTLPDAWAWILGEMAVVAAFFGAVVTILLVASEFAWRTARQNVIDGISKERWFLGKLLLLPVLALGFVLLEVVIGGGVALVSTVRAGTPGALVEGTDLAHTAGVGLAALGFAGLALLCAIVVRGAGAALGVFFLYLAVVEPLVGGLLRYAGADAVARYSPMNAFTALTGRGLWESGGGDGAAAVPFSTDALLPVLVTSAWTLLFIAASYIDFMRRDL